jgi:AcrR family transcriptional regulator
VASAPPRERRTRPANRRDLILSAATELFATRGFEYVGMSEIAEAVDVRPSALYRHFSGKEQLLAEIVHQGVANLQAAISGVDPGGGPRGLLDLAGFVIDNRHIATLIGREAPHLSEVPRAGLRSALGNAGQLLAGKIQSARPELQPHAAGLLAWAALAVLQSPAFHHAELSRAEYCAEVAALAGRVISARLPDEFTGEPIPPRPPGLLPYPRREALLARAIALFAERTYASVSIIDVAASLGIAGPSVYNHFRSKTDILATALSRGSACLSMQVTDILATAEGPAPALGALIKLYACFAIEHPAVIDLLISEVRSLPEPDREATMTAQRNYVAELVHLLRQVHPELSPAIAHVRIQAALMIANDVARIAHLRDQAGSAQAIASLCDQILALTAPR